MLRRRKATQTQHEPSVNRGKTFQLRMGTDAMPTTNRLASESFDPTMPQPQAPSDGESVERLLYRLGSVERTIDVVHGPAGKWSVWFTEFFDIAAIRRGEHWHLWDRGEGRVSAEAVVLAMTIFLRRARSIQAHVPFVAVVVQPCLAADGQSRSTSDPSSQGETP
jgi:hypothetical protein